MRTFLCKFYSFERNRKCSFLFYAYVRSILFCLNGFKNIARHWYCYDYIYLPKDTNEFNYLSCHCSYPVTILGRTVLYVNTPYHWHPMIVHQLLLFIIMLECIVILSSHIYCLFAYCVTFARYCQLKACFNIGSELPRSSIECLKSFITFYHWSYVCLPLYHCYSI